MRMSSPAYRFMIPAMSLAAWSKSTSCLFFSPTDWLNAASKSGTHRTPRNLTSHGFIVAARRSAFASSPSARPVSGISTSCSRYHG